MSYASSVWEPLLGGQGASAQLQALTVVGLVALGLLRALVLACAAGTFVRRQYLRPSKPLKRYGKWAIVTGATDGIGREYCNALAKAGGCSTFSTL